MKWTSLKRVASLFTPPPMPAMRKPVTYVRPTIRRLHGSWYCNVQAGTLNELRVTGRGTTPMIAYMRWAVDMIHAHGTKSEHGVVYTQWLNRAYWNTKHGVLNDTSEPLKVEPRCPG